jgi:hypothetical protein
MGRDSKVRAQIGWSFFCREFFILKTKMFRDVTTVLIEATHLKIAKSGQSQTLLVLFKTKLRDQARCFTPRNSIPIELT